MAYGSSIAAQEKDIVHTELHRFVSVNKFKFFGFEFFFGGGEGRHSLCPKQLGLVIFLYTGRNWKMQ